MAKARSSSVINVLIAGDTKKFRKALGKAGGQLADFSKKVGQISVATGAAFVGIGAKAVDLAVDFEESLSKAQQVFGDAAVGIENWAKTSATSVGMAQSEYLEAASSFGVFGKAAGLNGDLLAEFADELVTVSADVASFNNLRPEEALEKLQAGLRGSNEPLQSIGVLLNAAMVEAKALEMGLGDANGEISEGNKIMARQALILEKLGEQGALGDFSRTSGGLANQTRIMKARFKDLGIQLGRVLIPIAEKVSRLVGRLITFGEKIAEVYGEKGFKGVIKMLGKQLIKLAPIIKKAVVTLSKRAGKEIAKLANKFVDWIRPKIRPMLSRLLEFVQAAGNFILQKLPFIADKVGQLAAKFIEWITPLTKKLLQKLPTIIKTIVEFIVTKALPKIVEAGLKLASHLVPALLSFGQAVLEGIGSIISQVGGVIGRGFANMGSYALDQAGAFGNKILDAIMRPINFMGGLARTAFDAVVGAFKTGYNALAQAWNATIGGFGFTVPDWLKYTGLGAPIAGKEFRIPALTELATGGIVTRPTAALIGEAGPEAVIPLSKMGAMGGNITINMPVGANGEDVVRALEQYTRQQGNLQLPVSNTVRR
jgi:hypothetical protein